MDPNNPLPMPPMPPAPSMPPELNAQATPIQQPAMAPKPSQPASATAAKAAPQTEAQPATRPKPQKKPGEINIDFKGIVNNLKNLRPNYSLNSTKEINLVPDIKEEMIKALKLRNLTFFLCIVVASVSLGLGAIFASIAGGQQAAVDGKKDMINNLSSKITEYSDLTEYLTIRDQLGNLSLISDNKKLLSRTFNIISVLFPHGVADSISISEINVDLNSDSPTFTFDAQANAGNPPYIDYNVLESFKKSMPYLHYDYGKYVDKEGKEIPSYCIIENAEDGSILYDGSRKSYYAYWLITGEDCSPLSDEDDDGDEDETNVFSDFEGDYTPSHEELLESIKKRPKLAKKVAGYEADITDYSRNLVVKIWRTPQYNEWYKQNPKGGEPYMDLDGKIENVAHFESSCLTYQGTLPETTITDPSAIVKPIWDYDYIDDDSCKLITINDEEPGIRISDSSNGRNSEDDLVLRFSAVITLNPEVYNFKNKHVIALGPKGRTNVTDSYVQIQSIFGERARDCAANDTACNNKKNKGEND